MFTYYSFRNIYRYISGYYFQNQYVVIGKYILVIFHSVFVIRNVMCRYMLIYRNAEWVRLHGQKKFDNTCPQPKPSPVATGSSKPPKLKHETLYINQWSFC